MHLFLLFVVDNVLFVLENVESISLHLAGSSDKPSRDHQVPPRSHGEDRGRGAKRGESSFLTIIHQSLRDGFQKKVAVLLDFVQITSSPLPPSP